MKMIHYLTIFIVLILTGSAGFSTESIFPPGIDQRWYAKHYAALEEPPIWPLAKLDSTHTIYRYLDLPTWGNPLLIRVDEDEHGKKQLTFKKLSGDGGYEPVGSLKENKIIPMSDEDFAIFTNLLIRADFWMLPNELPDQPGFDGSRAIMEAVVNGRYHIVDWWSPEFGSFALACAHLQKLCLPDELIPPATLYNMDPKGLSLSIGQEDLIQKAKEWKTEEQARAYLGSPHAEEIDSAGKNLFYIISQGAILALRFDNNGIKTKALYYPKQENGQHRPPEGRGEAPRP